MVLKRFSLPVSGHLYDYEIGIAALRNFRGNSNDRAETIRKLCELSRDIDWNLGDPADYEPAYIKRIVNLFQATIDLIDAQPELNTDKIPTHREHIEKRLVELRAARPKREAAAV